MALPLPRHRFTVADYHQMATAGILAEDDRVELIEGEIVDMAPIGGPHIGGVNRLNRLFTRGLEQAIVQVQNPIRLDEHSEPQPDLSLLRPEARVYPAEPRDVLLVVEVAETSLRYDRQVKIPLYARAAIPEVWLVDLTTRTIYVHRDPTPDGYRTVLTVRGDEPLSPQAFPDFTLTADQILA
jgi:Uma2 family endonuclease